MDERDVRLLKAISDLETGSPERLHEETGIPVSTIHYRLNNLREAGVIANDLYDVDLDALGLGVTVVADVSADYDGPHEVFGEKLSAIEGVTQVFFTTGAPDFLVLARLPSDDHVGRFIDDVESLDDVTHTATRYVVSALKDASRPVGSYDLDTLVTELADDGDA